MQDKLNITSIDSIEHIFHMSDIHIRLLDRHIEYKKVFEKVYNELKNTPKNTVVFLGGDIVHSKLDMTAELVDMVSDFLINLEKIRPVILIKGNHDLNVKNKKRMDVLKPIVKSLNLKELFYLDDYTKIYNFKNIDFYLYPFWSEENPPMDYLNNGNFKIGMYHDALTGSKNSSGFILETNNSISRFKGMDIVLLGDIHFYQVLSDNPITVYPGSLIQQDYGESLDGHGYVFWNLKDKSHTFHEISNDYGFINVNLNEDTLNTLDKINIKYPSIKIKFDTKDRLLINTIKKEIQKKYPNIQSILPEAIKDNNSIKNKLNNTSINKKDTQIELLEKYFKENNLDFKNISNIHEEITNSIETKIKPTNNVWRPIKLKFSNMFSYGENNEIDFENFDGSYGIFAPNTSGKSSIMEIINFVCFNKTSYTNKVDKIVNVNKNNFEIFFTFENNGKFYSIHRTGKRLKDKFELNTSLYLVDKNETILENLTKSKNDIYKDLKEYLGEYEDFVLTALSLQGNKTNFIEKKQSERKELIQQFLEMDVFETLYEKSSAKRNEYANNLKQLNLKFNELINKDYDKDLEKNKELLELLYTNKQNNTLQLEQIKDNINNLKSKIVEVNNTLDITELEINLEKEIANLKNIDNNIRLKEDEIEKNKTIISINEVDNLNNNYDNFEEVINKYNNINNKIEKNNSAISLLNEQLLKYSHFCFNDECKDCNKNIETLNIKTDKERITILLEENNSYQIEINNILNKLNVSNIIDYKESYNLYKNRILSNEKIKSKNKDIELEILKIKNERIIVENKIQDLKDNIITVNKNKDNIINNNLIKRNIDKLNLEVNNLNLILKEDAKKEIELSSNIKNIEFKINEKEKLKNEILTLSEKYNDYNNYANSVSKNGIPLILIKSVIKNIEEEVNLILENVSNFRLILELIDSNIDAYITYNNTDKWDVSTISGMEKFITSLAIRIALINISQLPRPNFLCIDEGFGVLDKNNIILLKDLFEYLKTVFNFFIVISHIEVMKDFVDYSIDINKVNGFSEIRF